MDRDLCAGYTAGLATGHRPSTAHTYRGLPVDAIVGHEGSALLNIRTRQVFDMVVHGPSSLRQGVGSRTATKPTYDLQIASTGGERSY